MNNKKNQWTTQDAKARFSELNRKAKAKGPQFITNRGELESVLVSYKDYQAMKKTSGSFVQFMQSSPLMGLSLDIERDHSKFCKVEL